jgi:hypothetical protein
VGDLLGNAGNELTNADHLRFRINRNQEKAIPVRLVGYNQNGLRLIGSVSDDMDNRQYP